jgi:hypothetical protein
MSQSDIEYHMLNVVYPRAREVIRLWKDAGLDVLHLGHLARDSYRPPGIYEFGDVTPLIRDSDLARFRQLMDSAGYRLIEENPHTEQITVASAALADSLMAKPWGCTLSYARETVWPAVFWVNVGTTRRTGQFRLVDLEHWFDSPDIRVVTVMGHTEISCVPTWAHMLFEVADISGHAALNRVDKAKRKIEYAQLLASQPNVDWGSVLETVKGYEEEGAARYSRYMASLGAAAQPAIALDQRFGILGVRATLGYCFQAVEDYYPGTIPQAILDYCKSGPGGPLRRVYAHADPEYADRYATSFDGRVHGVVTFSIQTQLEQYGHLTNQELFSQGLVTDSAPIMDVFAAATEQTINQLYAA